MGFRSLGDEPGEVPKPAVAIEDRFESGFRGLLGFGRDETSCALMGFDASTMEVGVVGRAVVVGLEFTSADTGSAMNEGQSKSSDRVAVRNRCAVKAAGREWAAMEVIMMNSMNRLNN